MEMFSKYALKIKSAQIDDIESIINIVKSGFEQRIIEKTIYNSEKVEKYFKALLNSNMDNDLSMIICKINENIAGYIEFKITKDKAHLNYIVIRKEARGKKIGKKFLEEALYKLPSKVRFIELNVFEENLIALEWYKSLGFKEKNKFVWIEKEIISSFEEDLYVSPIIKNYPQHICNYDCYGFSQMSVELGLNIFDIGILGEKYFRITDVELLKDNKSLNSLYKIDRNRNVFGIVNEENSNILIEDYGFKEVIKVKSFIISKEKLIKNLKFK